MASTRSRPHGREHARPSTGGVAAEHATKIYAVALVGIVVIVAFLALTSIGHVIDAATQHFMLFYAGVFALIGLCASVGLGLVATDRMFLHPGQRVYIQAAHRAASFGALAFLIIHIVTEILAQRVHVIDAFVPFLSPFRTFYIGLGTIASDLVILLVITSIVRGRFNGRGKAWSWRAIHYTSYLCLVFGVWHGLLGGRPGKPYVDWSYGFVVAFVLLGLAIRVLSNSLRPKESLSAPPVDQSASSASAPLRAAAMLAQYGATRGGGRNAVLGASTGAQPMLSAPVSATVLTALPAGGPMAEQGQPYYEPGYEGPPRYLGAPRSEGTGPMPRATGPMPRTDDRPDPSRRHRLDAARYRTRASGRTAVGQRAYASRRHRSHATACDRPHATACDRSHATACDRPACRVPRPGRSRPRPPDHSPGREQVRSRVPRPVPCRRPTAAGGRVRARVPRLALFRPVQLRVARPTPGRVAAPGRCRRGAALTSGRRPGRCRSRAAPCRRRPIPTAPEAGVLVARNGWRPATTVAGTSSRRGRTSSLIRLTLASGTASPVPACPATEAPVTTGMAVTATNEPE